MNITMNITKQIIKKFKKGLCLEKKYKINIESCIEIKKNNFYSNNDFLELYHAPRPLYDSKDKLKEAIEDISTNGFKIDERLCTNPKGKGVYLSSHPYYQYIWLWHHVPIFVCYVHKSYAKRFRAELKLPNNYHDKTVKMFEYVVEDPKKVIPTYLICYKVNGNPRELYDFTPWIKIGEFGCNMCDTLRVICDCPV